MNLTTPWKSSADHAANGVSAKLDEIRQSLSAHAEHLADVAANYGSDAGSQASRLADDAAAQARKVAHETSAVAADVARDPVGSAGGFVQSLLDAIGALFGSLTATGRKTAADLGHDAQAAAAELRKVRITTEPKKTGPDFMPGITLLGGFGAGIALMYFFDPEQGKRRRALLRDQVVKWTRVTSETVSGKTKDLSNRAAGAAIEARKSVQGVMSPAPDTIDTDTQPWETVAAEPTAFGSADPSSTDTWGEQPQPTGSRIDIT
jgi:hypothetical protein